MENITICQVCISVCMMDYFCQSCLSQVVEYLTSDKWYTSYWMQWCLLLCGHTETINYGRKKGGDSLSTLRMIFRRNALWSILEFAHIVHLWIIWLLSLTYHMPRWQIDNVYKFNILQVALQITINTLNVTWNSR